MKIQGKDIIDSLYREYEQQMYRQAYSILKDEYMAEDAVHEAFIKLIRNRGKISDTQSRSVRSYVFKTLKSAALDLYRNKKKERESCVEFDESLENTLTAEETGLESPEDLLAKLPEKYAQVMQCLFMDGLSIRETAAVLQISESLVRKRCERSRKLLRRLPNEKGR